MSGYGRQNVIQKHANGSSGAATAVVLPGVATVNPVTPPIGANQRWRIHGIIASLSAAAACTLTIDDGVHTAIVHAVTAAGPVSLAPLDIQCAAGAEVTVTLSAPGTTLLGHLTVFATVES